MMRSSLKAVRLLAAWQQQLADSLAHCISTLYRVVYTYLSSTVAQTTIYRYSTTTVLLARVTRKHPSCCTTMASFFFASEQSQRRLLSPSGPI
jgi:hypothetical protein